MARRKSRHDLPKWLYFKSGGYYFVDRNTWTFLGRDYSEVLAKYEVLIRSRGRLRTLGECMDKYLLEVIPQKAANTQRDNRAELARIKSVFGHMQPDDVLPVDIYAYLDARVNEKTGKPAKTRANREIALLSHVFTKAMRWGVATRNPCLGVEKHVLKPRDRLVTEAELEAFSNFAGEFIAAYLGLKALTGLRKSDLLAIKMGDLTDEGIEVRTKKTGVRQCFLWTDDLRAAVDRILAIPRRHRVLEVVHGNTKRAIPDPERFLFSTKRRDQFTLSGFDTLWQRAMREAMKAGILKERFVEHDIRAMAATRAAEEGHDAQKLLGHASRQMTDKYVKSRSVVRVVPLPKKRTPH